MGVANDNSAAKVPPACQYVWQKWGGFLDNELAASERERLSAHLDECGHCREFVETQSQFNRLLRKSMMQEAAAMPAGLREKVLAVLDRQPKSGAAHGHDHGHDHGEPGHVHEHAHSHGMNVASRAALTVALLLCALGVFFFAASRRDPPEDLTTKAKLEGMEKLLTDARKDISDVQGELKAARSDVDRLDKRNALLEGLIDAERLRTGTLQKERDGYKRDFEVLAYFARIQILGAAREVIKYEGEPKTLDEALNKWRKMFPKAGNLPTVSIDDMKPMDYGVNPFDGVEVLWVVFGKRNDDKSHRFTLMTFDKALVESKYGSIDKVEIDGGDVAIILWRNQDKECYHALITPGGMELARKQLAGLQAK